jgi:ribonuclease HI
MSKFYVVWSGRKIGIYNTWIECKLQIDGYSGASYKSFTTKEEAYAAFTGRSAPIKVISDTKRPEGEYICVDAAFSGSTKAMEYRGINPGTGEELFTYGPLYDGTNNIGEYLAIVHALSLCQKTRCWLPIYSDSNTAMTWVSQKKANTNLVLTHRNTKIFDLLARAEAWLRKNTYLNEIRKWETQEWGENPADFGRK